MSLCWWGSAMDCPGKEILLQFSVFHMCFHTVKINYYLYCHVGLHDKLYFNNDHNFCFTWLIKYSHLWYLSAGYLKNVSFSFHICISCTGNKPLQDFKLAVARGQEDQFLSQSLYLKWKHFLPSVYIIFPTTCVLIIQKYHFLYYFSFFCSTQKIYI